ncbi:MAG: MopE-related protein [Pseudomonadota bacterium]|nr:MopE-related protein [Pseudomonadota bacterium]
MRLLLLTLALAACGEPTDTGKPEREPDCDPVTRYRDDDLDGYGDLAKAFETCNLDRGVEVGTDCDDSDATVHPDADEDCALEVDSNCDGSVGYADADDDGVAACEDCDDNDPTRSPLAAEFCDGIDEDCDGEVDESPADGRNWYHDADADGHGAEADYVRACEQPDGYIEDISDCDDTSADVHPGATELCNGYDDDCDGATDDADAADAATWYADFDSDGWGDDDAAVVSCEAPRRHVADAGDCDDRVDTVNPGATEVCNGADDDCDGGTDDAEATDATSWYVDTDGDGHGDAATTVLACDLGDGLSDLDDDCDDADATAFPGAPESCDDVDDDCDGTVDESPVDAPAWYTDADADGYGDASASTAACDAPAGMVAAGTDCDDPVAVVSPGGTERCNGADDDCDGVTDEADAADASTWYADRDGDGYGDPTAAQAACTRPSGYVADATDCDDTDAAARPGATETCDGADNDCDSTVDEPDAADATSWYADADGDTYGDAAVASTACEAPVGSVADATDCDDTDTAWHPGAAEADCADPNDYNCDGSVGTTDADADGYAACAECDDRDAAVSPGAVETCNTIDDDCDGVADEAGAVGGADWYADTDGDSHGDPTSIHASCDAPTGYVAADDDCDDTDAAISPDGTEACATAADDDCDGDTNPRDADGCTRFYFDYDGDSYGSTSNACLCEPDGYLTADNADDCDDGDAAVLPGATELWGNGVDEDCDGETDLVPLADADATFVGETTGDNAGYAVSGAGDLDADGYDDLVIGAIEADAGGTGSGVAYVVRGPVTGTVDLSSADAEIVGESAGDGAGYAVARAGDVDGDGYADLLVGANTTDATDFGSAYLLLGPVTGTIDLSAADAEWVGGSRSDEAGVGLGGGGDLDGDGLDDFAVGATLSDSGGTSSGGAFVVSGLGRGVDLLSAAVATLVGEARSDEAGYRVCIADDLDGDGAADLLVSGDQNDSGGTDAGAAYVVFGPVTGAIDLSTADARLLGEAADDRAGIGLDAPGDMDGDGHGDILVGASRARSSGAAYLVLGGVTGDLDLGDADAILEGVDANDGVGGSVAGAGDVNADGNLDLLLGASLLDGDVADAGGAYLVYGPVTGTRSLSTADGTFGGASVDSFAGFSVAGAGDTDGDGFADFLIGAYAADDGGSNAGTASLFLGR